MWEVKGGSQFHWCVFLSRSDWGKEEVDRHLDEDVKAQAVDVVDVAQAKQACKQATAEHAHCQVESDGQALPNDTAAIGHVEKTNKKQQQHEQQHTKNTC